MLFKEKIQEELLKISTCWIPNKELRHKIRDNAMVRFSTPLPNYYGDRKIYKFEETPDVIYEELTKNKPSLICRYGSNEFFTMRTYLKEGGFIYPRPIKKAMSDCAGFYPATNKNMKRFGQMLHALRNDIDILGVFSRLDEQDYVLKYIPETTKLVDLDSVYSIYNQHPWTRYLKDKKVLVIYQLDKLIEKQYREKRELLFKNPEILPEFELITYKPVQSLLDAKKELPYKDWFEALNKMKEDISKIDFDIALVGAGAYGIFLAHHCKMLGKQGIHLGGATQLLFGIGGSRWYNFQPEYLINANLEHWVRPSKDEKPKGSEKIEDSCYW